MRVALRAPALVVAALLAGAADEPPLTHVPVRAAKDGTFVLVDDPRVRPEDVFAGPGVACVVGRAGRFERAGVPGRFWVRGDGGAFEQRDALVLDAAEGERPDAALRDAVAALVATWGEPFRRTSSPYCGTLPALGVHRTAADDPAETLADRATGARTFVRFRSVEAALRFADLADRVAARLLASAGDGRDHATLARTIDSLTLPEVWRANPEGERGVSECALAFDGVPARGLLRCAALFRIVDPELHRMQFEAGVREARQLGRLSPRRAAATDGDVEIVANVPIGAAGGDRPPPERSAARAWRVVREAIPEEPGEAFLLVRPDRPGAWTVGADVERDDRAAREAHAWSLLVRRWSGVGGSVPGWSRARGIDAGLFERMTRAGAVTDAKGADVGIAFEDEASAERAALALAPAAAPFPGGAAVCATNRRDVAPLARMLRDTPDLAASALAELGWRPVCPCGGTYVAHPITRAVSCTAHGSDAAPLPDPPAPRALLRDLRREGQVVRFRVPIDWP